MAATRFGIAMLVARLERERSYDLCVRLASTLGLSLTEESGSFKLDDPGSRLYSVYFSFDALVDDLVVAGRTALDQMD